VSIPIAAEQWPSFASEQLQVRQRKVGIWRVPWSCGDGHVGPGGEHDDADGRGHTGHYLFVSNALHIADLLPNGHQPADALSPGHRDLSSGGEVPAGRLGAQDLQAANGQVEGPAGLARGPAKDGPHGPIALTGKM